MRASRVSHSTVAKGSTPGVVNRLAIDSAFPGVISCPTVGCGVASIDLLLSDSRSLRATWGVREWTDDHGAPSGRNREVKEGARTPRVWLSEAKF
jgi:hypothetical protein